MCDITKVKHTCLQPATGLVSRLVFTGVIPVVSKTSKVNIWLCSYDHLTDVGQRGSCKQLSQGKGLCCLINKKEALSGLIQVNGDEERNGGQAGRVSGCQL